MAETKNKYNLLLGVCGCAQAESTIPLVKRILDLEVVDLEVVSTEMGAQFFDRRELEKLLGKEIFVSHLDHRQDFDVPHIQLAEWADLAIVYPTSANTLARCANGFTDALLSNVVMATEAPVLFGPTMNERMYEAPAVKKNMRVLEEYGFRFLPREISNVKVWATGEIKEKEYPTHQVVLKTLVQEIKNAVEEN